VKKLKTTMEAFQEFRNTDTDIAIDITPTGGTLSSNSNITH